MRLVFALCAALTLAAACSERAVYKDEAPVETMAFMGAPAQDMAPASPVTEAGNAAPAPDAPAPAAPAAPMLAYVYRYGIEAPAARIRPLLSAHEAACRQAGAAVCQATGSNVRDQGSSNVMGQLTLRAQPDWLAEFRAGLEADARAAGGRLTFADTQTEDLTRQIIDTEARLRAQTTLRDRLQALLASRPGDLKDLLELEEALARVQGEIDSAQSNLSHMRQRVQTSTLTIAYVSAPSFASEGAWAPVREAVGGFQGVMAATLAALILAVAALIPLGLVAGGLYWLVRRWWLRRRARTPARAPLPPAAP